MFRQLTKSSLTIDGTSNRPAVSKPLRMKPLTMLHSCVMLLTLVSSFAAVPSIFAQQIPELQVGSGALARFGDLLREHNIDLTEDALLRALKNTNSDVRFLAAMKLQEDNAVDATPAIKEALAAEKVPRARVNIALALGLLGDPGGHDELKQVCADRGFIPGPRLYAVRYMFDLHFQNDEDCLAAAEEIVDSKNTDFGDRDSALDLLPQFQNLTAEESQRVFELVIHRLEDDPEPVVQMAASSALASLGDASAIPYLEAAIEREKEEAIRSVFELNLKKLQKKAKD